MTCGNEWLKAGSRSACFHAGEVRGWETKQAVCSQHSCCTVLNEASFAFSADLNPFLNSGPKATNFSRIYSYSILSVGIFSPLDMCALF